MMAFTEGKTNKECSFLGGLVGWKITKSHGGCVLHERAVKKQKRLKCSLFCYRLDAKMGDVDYLTTTLALFTM